MTRYLSFFFCCSLVVMLTQCSTSKKDNDIPSEDQHFQNPLNPKLNAINDAIEEDPNNADYYYKRSKIYYEDKKYRQALNDVNTAIHFDNTNANFYILLANIYTSINKNSQALKAAKQAELMNSQDPELYILISKLYLHLEDKKNAEYYLNQSAILAPLHSEISVLKGNILAERGDTLESILEYHSALKKDAENIDALKELSKIYQIKRKNDSLMLYVIQGRSIDKEEPLFDYLEGKFLESLNYTESAKSAYSSAINHDSTYYQASNSLANLYYKGGFFKEAYTSYKHALLYDNDILLANIRVAEILENSGNGSQSIPYYERAGILDPDNIKIKTSLGKLYTVYGKASTSKIENISVDKVKISVDSAHSHINHTGKPPIKVKNSTTVPKPVKEDNTSVLPATEKEKSNETSKTTITEVKPIEPEVPVIVENKKEFNLKSIFKKKKKTKDSIQ